MASSKAAKSRPVEVEEGTLASHTKGAIVHTKVVAVGHTQMVVNHTLGTAHMQVAASRRVINQMKGLGWRHESRVVHHTWVIAVQTREVLLAFGLGTKVVSVTAIGLH